MATSSRFRAYAAVVLFLPLVSTAPAQYSGGTGEPDDPYQMATAADLIALGETPEDYDKHLILTADINLAPNLSGRDIPGCRLGFRGRDDQRYGGHLVDRRRQGLSEAVVGVDS